MSNSRHAVPLTPEQILAALTLFGWESARDKYRDIWIFHSQRKLISYVRYTGGVVPMFELPVSPLSHEIIDPAMLLGREAERWKALARYVLAWEMDPNAKTS